MVQDIKRITYDRISSLTYKNGIVCRYCTNFYQEPTNYRDKQTTFALNVLARNGCRCKKNNSNLIECSEFSCNLCNLECSYIDKNKIKDLRSDPFVCRQCKKPFLPVEIGGIVGVLTVEKGKVPEECPIRFGKGIVINDYLCLECQKNPREDKTSEIRIEKLPPHTRVEDILDDNKKKSKNDKPDYIS